MAQSLATSKRKFYKLLDNLSTSKPNFIPSTDEPNTADSPERPTKRSRMVDLPRPTSVRSSTKTTVRILSSNFEAGNRASISSQQFDTSKSTFTYSPWSHDQFLVRLKTFADIKSWSPKPDRINEVAWAKRGWTVIAQDEVACKSCGERVLIKLFNNMGNSADGGEQDSSQLSAEGDQWWSAEAEEGLIEKYESLLAEGHDQSCLWRKSGSKDDIYRITFTDQSVWQQDLLKRYCSLSPMAATLPATLIIPKITDDDNDMEQFQVDRLVRWFTALLKAYHQSATQTPKLVSLNPISATVGRDDTIATDDQVNPTTLVMALCGWSGQNTAGVQIASCDRCFARLGLWMYKASDGVDHKLDPVALHREHCPWKNPTSQNGFGRFAGMAAWEIQNESICSTISRTQRQKRLSTRIEENFDDTDSPRQSREEVDNEDRARESKLARLRRALSVKKLKKPSGY